MKWIMVNIMNSQEFACQILNRDLWSDSEVQKTIRENFFFLQVCLLRLVYKSILMMNLMAYDINRDIHLPNIHTSALSIPEPVQHNWYR